MCVVSSNTQVLSWLSVCVQDYFNRVSKVLDNIVDFTSTIATVHTYYVQIDNELIDDVDIL